MTKETNKEVKITWNDGTESTYTTDYLQSLDWEVVDASNTYGWQDDMILESVWCTYKSDDGELIIGIEPCGDCYIWSRNRDREALEIDSDCVDYTSPRAICKILDWDINDYIRITMDAIIYNNGDDAGRQWCAMHDIIACF